ncbi:thioredoxin family protein [Candidatus Gracilibacteria bacterium]|nr:thioredoxin family protein [Candidatus Gracilibacteria bacterium]
MSVLTSKYVVLIGSIAVLTGCSGTVPTSTSVLPTTVSIPPAITSILPTTTSSAAISTSPIASPVVEGVNNVQSADPIVVLPAAPVYQNYTPELYASLKGQKAFVLFFHASWCPTCRRMEQEITSALASFPPDTVILKTNYDTATALKKTWGVQVQSTIVVIDAQGESVFKGVDPGIAKMKDNISQSLL